MTSEDKSFITFLRQVYGSFEGTVVLLSLGTWIPTLYLSWLYSPSDFARGSGTWNSWWIVVIGFVFWIHTLLYIFWRTDN